MIDAILYILLGLMTVGMTVLGGFLSSTTVRHKVGFLVLASISVVLIFFTGLRNHEAQTRLDKSLDTLQKSSETVLNMSQETVRIGRANTELQERVLEQSKDITKLSKQSINTATGGDSFGYIAAIKPWSANSWMAVFIPKGKFPLYNVHARMVDLERFAKIKDRLSQMPISEIFEGNIDLDIGDVAATGANGKLFTTPIPTSDASEHSFNIYFSARNGSWMQSLKLARINGESLQATQVRTDEGIKNKVIFEQIDNGFPRNKKGEIEWFK